MLLLCVLTVIVAVPLPHKFSYVYNENGRLASGLIHLCTGDYSVFHVNPPLSDMIGSLPAFCAGTYCPTTADLGFSHFGRMEYKAGDVWIKKNSDHFFWMQLGRYCMIVFVLLGTIICYIWTKELFGMSSAVISTLTWIFSPYILGYGCLICPDVPSAAVGITALYLFHRWLKRPEMLETFIAGIILGLAELTKFTLLIFYPLFIVLWILYRISEFKLLSRQDWFQQLKQIIIIFATSLLIINMGYLFEDTGKQLGSFKFQTTLFTGYKNIKDIPINGANRFENTLLGKIPVPLPTNFVQGIDTQRLDFEHGLPSYLRGEWSDHGCRYYYLYALLIKTPLGTISLFLLAIFCTFFQKGYNVSWRDEMVILLSGIVLLAFVSSQTGFSVHSRYIIPALPFFFIWISKIGNVFILRKRFLQMIISILLFWSMFSSLWVYPHCISYFNELAAILPTPNEPYSPQEPEGTPFIVSLLNAGSRNGGRHLLNSNIDWGQDLFCLERWCLQHPEIHTMRVTRWSSYPLEQTKIPSHGIPAENNLQPGWYALSVNDLYNREKQYRHFLHLKPVARVGYSMYIYHVTPEDANRVRTETMESEH
ncbi:MAG: glycosyltransferase family 39 protein [Planctomycetaceae bacterium]|nr:glycosyltransferase family 39 protein [Planctomycetaceae bacterium]